MILYLIVLIEPKEGQIGDSDRLPVVRNLLSSAVDDMGHFVCDHELQVL